MSAKLALPPSLKTQKRKFLPFIFTVLFLISLTTFFAYLSPNRNINQVGKMGEQRIVHIVMFAFKEETTAEQVEDTCTRMLALQTKCVHPTTKQTYVKSAMGGIENSPEPLSGGLTHIFVSEFTSEADREYYLKSDPAHLAFVASLGGVVSKAQVVDFTPDVF